MVTNNQPKKTKRTYARDEINQLLLKETFERDLSLFSSLLERGEELLGGPLVEDDWSFTVVNTNGRRELFINVPPE